MVVDGFCPNQCVRKQLGLCNNSKHLARVSVSKIFLLGCKRSLVFHIQDLAEYIQLYNFICEVYKHCQDGTL